MVIVVPGVLTARRAMVIQHRPFVAAQLPSRPGSLLSRQHEVSSLNDRRSRFSRESPT
jgi:hypothetical protein